MAGTFSSGNSYEYPSRSEYGDENSSITQAAIMLWNSGSSTFHASFGRSTNAGENTYMYHFGSYSGGGGLATMFAVFNGTGGSITGTFTVTAGTWYLAVGRYVPDSKLEYELYTLTGSSVASRTGTAPSANGNSTSDIGIGRGHGNAFDGNIARTVIFKSDVSNASILDFMLDGKIIREFPVWFSDEPDRDYLRGDTRTTNGSPGTTPSPTYAPHDLWLCQGWDRKIVVPSVGSPRPALAMGARPF